MEPLTDVSNARGAPMGRSNTSSGSVGPIEFEIARLDMVDHDYDEGGAYWGGVKGEHIYRAVGAGSEGAEEMFVRATGLQDAKRQVAETYPQATFAASVDLDSMVSAYREAALWSTTNSRHDDDDENEPENLDKAGYELAESTVAAMRNDCDAFLSIHRGSLARAEADYGFSIEQAGHDFWLCRNGHGAGFWDRDMGEVGDLLADVARSFGEAELYVGDDDLVYQSGTELGVKAGPTR